MGSERSSNSMTPRWTRASGRRSDSSALKRELSSLLHEALERRRHRLARYEATEPQRAFHVADAVGRLLVGGNRSGKTTAGAVETLWWLLGAHPFVRTPPPPVYGRCVAPDLPGSMDEPHVQRDKIREWAPARQLRGGTWSRAYSVIGHTLHFANGSRLEFKSSGQDLDQHAGAGLAFVWLDEECPRSIWVENLARLSEGTVPGRWWLTMTPVQGLVWIEQEIYRAAIEGHAPYAVVEADIESNRANLPPGFIETIEASLREEDKVVRLRGRWGVRQGLVYDLLGASHLFEADVQVVEE